MVLSLPMRGHRAADSKAQMSEFVRTISRLGPNINTVSKSVGVFKETGRYWYKKKLLARGFAVQASLAYEMLGLKYIIMLVDFEDDFEQYAKPILWAMSELCYVRYYNRTLPGGKYVVHAIVPEERVAGYTSFFEKLKEKELRQKAEVTLHVKGKDIFVENAHEDLYAAIDQLMDKLDRQVCRHKDKLNNHHHVAAKRFDATPS